MHDRAGTADHTVGNEHLLEAVQQRLDANPKAMRQRRETVEHPFGTMKPAWERHTHQNASRSSRRDDSLGPGLQSDTGLEHHRKQAADRRDRSLKRPRLPALKTDLPGNRFCSAKTPSGHAEYGRTWLVLHGTAIIGRLNWSGGKRAIIVLLRPDNSVIFAI